jgi:methionyl-tRNA formyltransferase
MKQSTKILFMGTPDLAAAALERLFRDGHEIVGVITQPDRPSGRGKKIAKSSVKIKAELLGLRVIQPTSKAEVTIAVKEICPDVAVVAAYGIIIEQTALDIPKYGFINIHASLLPKYRGASPITEAILSGEAETGITIMHMDAGMDTGDIISSYKLPIKIDATTESLTNELTELGAEAISETLPLITLGKASRTVQDNDKATYCKKIVKEDGHIDWRESASTIERKIRAYNPWPKCFTVIENTRYQITKAHVLPRNDLHPGVISLLENKVLVGSSDSDIEIIEIQPESKRLSTGTEFARNHQDLEGKIAI